MSFEELFEGFARRGRLDQVLAELAQYRLVAEQLGRLVVDHEDVDLVRSYSCPLSNVRLRSSVAVGCDSDALAMQPHAQRRQQLLGVDRLGEIVRGAGLEALLAVALHRLRGQRDDRQPRGTPDSAGSPASSRSRPSPAS